MRVNVNIFEYSQFNGINFAAASTEYVGHS